MSIQFILSHEDQQINVPLSATIITIVLDEMGATHRIDYRNSKISNFSNDIFHFEASLHENNHISGI